MLVVLHESSAGALRRSTPYFFINLFSKQFKAYFYHISEASGNEDRNSASTRLGFIAWCRDSPLPITVCVYSKLAAWDGIAQ